MDAKGGVAHHAADKLCVDATKTFADFARACELFADAHNRRAAAAAAAAASPSPPPSSSRRRRPLRHVAVARYPAPHASRKLTAKQLRSCLAALDARRLGRAAQPPPHGGAAAFLPAPYCIQAHVPAAGDARYVTSFMWADTAVMCDTTVMSHAAMYEPLPRRAPPTTAGGEGGYYDYYEEEDEDEEEDDDDDDVDAYETPPSSSSSAELELTLRQQTLRLVSHVSTAHASQLLGLVLEYVIDARTEQLYLNAVLATCWPEPWSRHRKTNKSGGGMGVVGGGGGGGGGWGRGGGNATMGDASLPRLTAGGQHTVTGGALTRPNTSSSLTASPSRGGFLPSSPSRESSLSPSGVGVGVGARPTTSGLDGRYGVNSAAASVLSPRYSERGVWSKSHGPLTPAEEAMSRAAATVVRTGRAPTSYTCSASSGYAGHGGGGGGGVGGKLMVNSNAVGRGGTNTARASAVAAQTAPGPMVAQLTRRLEEVREALQEQTLRATEATLDAFKARVQSSTRIFHYVFFFYSLALPQEAL